MMCNRAARKAPALRLRADQRAATRGVWQTPAPGRL
jgi:hypothetical protein